MDLTTLTDEDLDALRVAVLTEQERRRTLAETPDLVEQIAARYATATAVPYVAPTGGHDAYGPGRKVVWTDGHTYRNDSGGWLSHSPEEYPRGWTCLDCEPAGEWPQWVQPQPGVVEPFAKDAKVTHKDLRWTSNLDGNVWEPGVYGWTLAP